MFLKLIPCWKSFFFLFFFTRLLLTPLKKKCYDVQVWVNTKHSTVISILSPSFLCSRLPTPLLLVFVSLSLGLPGTGERIPFNSSTKSQTIKAQRFCFFASGPLCSVCLIHLHTYAATKHSLPPGLPHTQKWRYTGHIHPLTRSHMFEHTNKHTKSTLLLVHFIWPRL